MNFIKRLPLPIAGTALGIAALGNLLQTYDLAKTLRPVFGWVAGIIVILLLIKLIMNSEQFMKELDNPVVFSSFVTFFMAITILSTYVPKNIGPLFWYVGVCGHILYMVWFLLKYTKDFKLGTVFPSWFIPTVGFVAGSVAAPAHGFTEMGKILFWVGLVLYVITFALVTNRVMKLKEMPVPAQPTMAIYAAPSALLLAGYISSFSPSKSVNITMVTVLAILSIVLWIYAIYVVSTKITGKFFPSFSSFTFPFVIQGIALKMATKFLTAQGATIAPTLGILVKVMELVALVLVVVVLVRYIIMMVTPPAVEPSKN